jgi:hypothetical protein
LKYKLLKFEKYCGMRGFWEKWTGFEGLYRKILDKIQDFRGDNCLVFNFFP